MRGIRRGALLLLALAAPLSAAPVAPMPRSVAARQPAPDAAPELTGPASAAWLVELKARNVPKGAAIIWDVFPEDKAQTRVIKAEQALILAGPAGEYRVKCRLIKGEDVTELRWAGALTGGAPLPPSPGPPGPGPAPPGPTPGPPAPVTSFRVVFVWESATTPTAAQLAAMNGKTVRDYLNAKCTKEDGLPGYRVYDPQANVANEQPTMKALWAAVAPKLTTIPCVVVEVNGKADILPFPASQEEAVATFKKYLGEK